MKDRTKLLRKTLNELRLRDKKDLAIDRKNRRESIKEDLKLRRPKRIIKIDTGKIEGIENVVKLILRQLNKKDRLISIEGLSGAGKSSTAELLQKKLKAFRFSMGEVFRYLTYKIRTCSLRSQNLVSRLDSPWLIKARRVGKEEDYIPKINTTNYPEVNSGSRLPPIYFKGRHRDKSDTNIQIIKQLPRIFKKLSYQIKDGRLWLFDGKENITKKLAQKLRAPEVESTVPEISAISQKIVIQFAAKEIEKIKRQTNKKILIEGRAFTIDFLPSDLRIKLVADLKIRAKRRLVQISR